MNNSAELNLNLAGINDEKELHEYLFEVFHFPEYYGSNWDAFDECIRDVQLPGKLKIHHFKELELRVPRGARFLKECLESYMNNQSKTTIEFCHQCTEH